MATERDPYRVLGLSPSASQAEIASAYRRLLREHHPDTRTHHQPADPAADEHLQHVLTAYALLRDPEHRAAHDQTVTGREAAGPPAWQRRSPPLRVVVVDSPPPRRRPTTGLWVGPV
ncbi:MAG: J domain-containing protein [Comamonadaceae bacterium]|nr:MAG: J domain-containing protein [Comamonadaceae bacterium]